jgi:chemotaxis protein MotB
MKVRQRSVPVSHDRWLVSYADFVTLLFAFFVVLYASAQMDRQRAVRLSDAIRSAFQELGAFQSEAGQPVVAPNELPLPNRAVKQSGVLSTTKQDAVPKEEFSSIRRELERALADEIKRNDVALHMEADGLVVSLREMGFFDSGSASIKPGAENAFGRAAVILRAHACALRIEGHTDNVPIHTSQFASNWELSTARATGIVKSLIEQYGISADRLSAAGYAEFHPVSNNASAQGRQLNRRVDVVILRSPEAKQGSGEDPSTANLEALIGP